MGWSEEKKSHLVKMFLDRNKPMPKELEDILHKSPNFFAQRAFGCQNEHFMVLLEAMLGYKVKTHLNLTGRMVGIKLRGADGKYVRSEAMYAVFAHTTGAVQCISAAGGPLSVQNARPRGDYRPSTADEIRVLLDNEQFQNWFDSHTEGL